MKIAVSGPREPPPGTYVLVRDWVNTLPEGSTLYHGNAKGVDRWARDMARQHGLGVIAIQPHYGGSVPDDLAPLVRNAELVSKVDEVVGFWHGHPYGGTLNTLWVSTLILGKTPKWFRTDTEAFEEVETVRAFNRICSNPPAHWVEAYKIWTNKRDS